MPSQEDLNLFNIDEDKYLSLSSIEKCKLDIKIRLHKLEKYAISNNLPLNSTTISKFCETDQNESDMNESKETEKG